MVKQRKKNTKKKRSCKGFITNGAKARKINASNGINQIHPFLVFLINSLK